MKRSPPCPACRTEMIEEAPRRAGTVTVRRFHCPKCNQWYDAARRADPPPDAAATDTQDHLATQALPADPPRAGEDEQDAIGTEPLADSTADAQPTLDLPHAPPPSPGALTPAEWVSIEGTQGVYSLAEDRQKIPLIGKLGRFELRSILGQGRFGTVYQGYDPVLERLVAIKVPKLAEQSSEQVQRFLAEAKAAARLRHPNIVAVFDTGAADNAAFIAAEFIEGLPLSAHIANKPPGLDQAVRWVHDLALALAYAHEEGIVHRDVKPANILIDQKRRPLLTDFGLATRAGAGGAGKEGDIVGTPAYMAPEQARGDVASIGPASDQYALGVILYELLTGKRPFDGTAPVVLHKQLHVKPLPPRKRNRRIPRDLEAVCLRAMSKKPARRYPNLTEFALDLQRWLNHEPVRVRASTRLERGKLWIRRHRNWVIAASVAMAGILLAVVAWSVVGAIQLRKELEIARAQELIRQEEQKRIDQLAAAEQKRKEDLAAVDKELREKRRLESADLRRRAVGLCQEQHIDEGLILLAEALEVVAKTDDALAEEVRIEIASWERQLLPLSLVAPASQQFAGFSPDGRIALTLQEQSRSPRTALVRCYDLAAGQWLGKPIEHHNGAIAYSQFTGAISPDGRTLLTVAAANDSRFRLWNVETGEPIGEPLEHNASIRVFSADGKLLLTANRQTTPAELRFWDTATGRPAGKPVTVDIPLAGIISGAGGWLMANGQPPETDLRLVDAVFSPDGKTVLTRCTVTIGSLKRQVFRLWNTATRQAIGSAVTSAVLSANAQLSAFSPDSQMIALCTESTGIQLHDTLAFRPIGPPLRHEHPVHMMVFARSAPDSNSASPGGGSGTPSHHLLITQTGDDAAAKRENRATIVPTITVWDVQLNYSPTPERPEQRPIDSPLRRAKFPGLIHVSADGDRVLTAEPDRTVRLWDTVTGKPIGAAIPCESINLEPPRFSPDGRWLLLNEYRNSNRTEYAALLYDARTGRAAGQPLRHRDFSSVKVSPDGRSLAAQGDTSATQIWSLAPRRQLVLRRDSPAATPIWRAIDSFTISPDGTTVEIRERNRLFRWDAASGEPIHQAAPAGARPERSPGAGSGQTLAMSPDGSLSLTNDSGARTLQLRITASEQPLGPPIHYTDLGHCAAFSPDGRRALVCHDEEVTLFDATSADVRTASLRHSQKVVAAIFSPDGRLIATAGGRHDGTARLWNAATGELVHGALYHYHLGWPDGIHSIAFSPTGRFLVSGDNHRNLVWDTRSGKMVGPAPDEKSRNKDQQPDIRLVRFSRNDSVVLTGIKQPEKRPNETPKPAQVFQLWDGMTGRPLGGMIGPELPASSIDKMRDLAVAFTPDARAILVGYGKLAHFWDTRMTGRLGLPLSFPADIKDAIFSPDGRQVLILCQESGSSNAELSIWPCHIAFPGDPAGIKSYLQTATGLELASDGKRLNSLGQATWEERRKQLAGSAARQLEQDANRGSGSEAAK